MARLTEEHKRFIVMRLACFAGPSEIVREVKELYGLDLALQHVQYYDPDTPSTATPKKWAELHAECRKKYVESSGEVAVAIQRWRLERLLGLYRHVDNGAPKGINVPLALQILEQAAKEAGGAFTNKRRHDVFPLPHPDDLTEEEQDRILDGEDPWKVVAERRGRGAE